MKECCRCKETKLNESFSKDSRHSTGLQTRCKECQAIVKKEMAHYYRGKHLEYKYGMTHEDYASMLLAQDSKCAVCGIEQKFCENQRLAVDHDHDTGLVRALLCKKCNQALGLLQDSSEFAKKAAEYLIRFNK